MTTPNRDQPLILRDLANQLPSHQLPITENDLDVLLLHVLRLPTLFSEARLLLQATHFERTTEPHYALLWASAVELHTMYGRYTYETLAHAVVNKIHLQPEILTPNMRDTLLRGDQDGLIFAIMHCHESQLIPDLGRTLLRQFLTERTVIRPMQTLIARPGVQTYVANFSEILAAATAESRRIDSLRTIPSGMPLPSRGEALPDPPVFMPSGLSYIDECIRGQRRGDANGILGVRGGGKTTLGVDIALSNAKMAFLESIEANRPSELSVFLSYEEPTSKIQPRFWANGCSIQSRRIEQLQQTKNWDMLTTPANLLDYERNYQRMAGIPESAILSETERWDAAHIWMNRSFVLLDMSGSEQHPGAGTGYVPEIVSVLDRLVSERQVPIRSVLIDYAGLMARRHMAAKNMSDERLRHLVGGGLGDMVRQQISERFNCVSWILHQFNSDQAKKSATTILHDTDSAEGRNFAENLAVCGCLGTIDKSTGCMTLHWAKTRYIEGRTVPIPTLQIASDFRRFIDVSHRFTLDAGSGQFVDPQTSSMITGGIDERSGGPISAGPAGLAGTQRTLPNVGRLQ